MSAKEDRRIRTKTVRSLLGLAHDRFRQKPEWMCRKCGKRLIVVNEAYTSKTRSWDGFVNENLGGAKTVSDGSIVVDRDMNGARGIMLRALYGNLGRFRAAGDDVALVAESIKCLSILDEEHRVVPGCLIVERDDELPVASVNQLMGRPVLACKAR